MVAVAEENALGYRTWRAPGSWSDERLEALRVALQNQRNGTQQVAVTSQSTASLIDINLAPELAQRWQVCLLAWTVGAIPTAPTSTAGIADFGTRNFAGTFNLKVQLQYGTSAGSESCFLDYPANGLTFEVEAARLALSLPSQNLVTTGAFSFPLIGAFATPSVGRAKGKIMPTWTSSNVAIAQSGSAVFAAPPRAIGYRLFTPDAAAFTVTVQEVDYGSNVLAQDWTAAAPLRSSMPATDWCWLVPAATCLKVTNNDAGAAHSIKVVWVLDLA